MNHLMLMFTYVGILVIGLIFLQKVNSENQAARKSSGIYLFWVPQCRKSGVWFAMMVALMVIFVLVMNMF
jgi:hypothetical protein